MSSSKEAEQAAQTVYRNKEGKRVTRAELLEERARGRKVKTPEELEREHFDWNVDTAAKRREKERLERLEDAKQRGYTQYATDEEYNKRLKEELRPDDPMYEYFMSKRREEEEEEQAALEEANPEKDAKPTVGDYLEKSTKPKYKGPMPAPNRFDIPPGYRWDGISRGNGYEAKRLLRMNITKMRKQQAYMWSVSNL